MDYRKLKWILRAVRYRYLLEQQEVKLVQRHLAAGDVAVDVGAHKGAQRLLTGVGPCLLFACERRHRSSGSVAEVFNYLQGLDYSGYFIERSDYVDIDRFDPDVHQASSGAPGYVSNFLFLKAPRSATGAGA